jgi:hypothetical protein
MATVYTRAAKGSALTWTEGDANITNLNTAKIENVVEDTTPQLGGNLDVNGNSIVSVSNGNIAITPNGTGSVVIDGNSFPQAIGASGEILTADGSGAVEWKLNQTISAQVYNADSVTINKGEPVYVFGAQGTNISVKRALNTGDATSAQTLGLANESIAAGATGIVICQGVLKNIDTSTPSYTAGQALYLGATAGSITTTKPFAPNHLVYLGFVETVNSVSGRIYVRVQNGYELDEIHDVQITTTPSNNQVLSYETASSLWKPRTITEGVTITDDTTTNGTRYILFDDSTSGTQTGVNVSSTGLTFNPLLGRLSTTQVVAAVDGIVGSVTPNSGTFTSVTVNAAGELRLRDTDSSNYVALKAPSTVSSDVTYTLPGTDGTAGWVLSTSGTGTLSWIPVTGGVTLTDDTSTNATRYIIFDDSTSGSQSAFNVSSTKLTFNPSTGAVTATSFVGSLSGNASTATTATNVTVTQSSTNATYYPLMSTTSGTGDKAPVLGTNFTMNPSSGALTAVSLTTSGSIIPNSTGGANINFGTSTLTANAWTTLGISMRQQARNYTDSSSTGTVAVSAINGFGIATLNSSNVITVTEAANIYVQPPAATGNTTITTSYGLISTGRIKATDFVGTIGATTANTGAFTTLTANTSASLKAINEGALYDLGTTGGTVAPNVANGNVQKITLNSALTINAFTSPVAGQSLTLIIYGGTAYTSITSTMKFAGGIKTLTATAGCIDILSVYYDGTNYFASLGKGFA